MLPKHLRILFLRLVMPFIIILLISVGINFLKLTLVAKTDSTFSSESSDKKLGLLFDKSRCVILESCLIASSALQSLTPR